MLSLDGRISSEELNCGIFHAMSSDELDEIVRGIKFYRDSGDRTGLRPPVVPDGDRVPSRGVTAAA
jgi:hypothetical protein